MCAISLKTMFQTVQRYLCVYVCITANIKIGNNLERECRSFYRFRLLAVAPATASKWNHSCNPTAPRQRSLNADPGRMDKDGGSIQWWQSGPEPASQSDHACLADLLSVSPPICPVLSRIRGGRTGVSVAMPTPQIRATPARDARPFRTARATTPPWQKLISETRSTHRNCDLFIHVESRIAVVTAIRDSAWMKITSPASRRLSRMADRMSLALLYSFFSVPPVSIFADLSSHIRAPLAH